MNEKDNLKQLIMEMVNTTIREFSVKHQLSKGHQGYGKASGHGVAAANYHTGPLRTVAKPAIQERNKGQGSKGRVKSRDQVDHIEEESESKEDWEEEELSREGWISTKEPKIIEVDTAQEEEMSTISSSLGKEIWPKRRTCLMNAEVEERSESGFGSNFHSSLDQWSEEEEEEDNDRNEMNDIDEQEPDESEESSDDSLEESRADSEEYEKKEGPLYEDDDAFFERLAEMTDVLDTQDQNNEGVENNTCEEGERKAERRVTRSGRVVKEPTRLIEEMGALSKEVEAKTSWKECLIKAYEIALVGAGIGGGFNHSSKLNVIKYNQAMRSDDLDELTKWIKGMDEENARFLFNKVWVAVLKGQQQDVIPITMTWALKMKSSGVVQARCNVRGFEQIPHVHYDPNTKSSPVTTQAAIFVAFTIR
jgi:hypothetical protein